MAKLAKFQNFCKAVVGLTLGRSCVAVVCLQNLDLLVAATIR